MVQADSENRSIVDATDRAQDAAVERLIALGFVAAFGVWMLLASALGVG
jgi:hypothetical protein